MDNNHPGEWPGTDQEYDGDTEPTYTPMCNVDEVAYKACDHLLGRVLAKAEWTDFDRETTAYVARKMQRMLFTKLNEQKHYQEKITMLESTIHYLRLQRGHTND